MSSFNVSVFSLPLFLSAALLSFPGEEAQARAAHALAVRYRLVSRGGGVGSADIGVRLTRAGALGVERCWMEG